MALRSHSPNQESRHLNMEAALLLPLVVTRNSENGDAFHRADGGITMLICHSSTCCAAGRLKSWLAGPAAVEHVRSMKSSPRSVRLLWLPGQPPRTAGPEDSGCQERAPRRPTSIRCNRAKHRIQKAPLRTFRLGTPTGHAKSFTDQQRSSCFGMLQLTTFQTSAVRTRTSGGNTWHRSPRRR